MRVNTVWLVQNIFYQFCVVSIFDNKYLEEKKRLKVESTTTTNNECRFIAYLTVTINGSIEKKMTLLSSLSPSSNGSSSIM